MANLLSTLLNSSSALDAYERVLSVTQNNVANSSTPGYAKQGVSLEALPMDQALGASGGVRAGKVENYRDEYAEQAVRSQTSGLGAAQQSVTSLTAVQSQFDISGKTGIAAAMNNLFSSFSAWGQNPSDLTSRQAVLSNATSLADSFNQAAAGLANVASNTQSQIVDTVNQVNQIVGKLRGYNSQIMEFDKNDPGMDAQVHNTLEQLSQYVNFTAIHQDNGTVTVLMNDETPLLIDDRQYNLSSKLQGPDATAPNPDAPPSAHVYSFDGREMTSKASGGQLGALLDTYNNVLPSYLGDANNAGSLNTLAEQFANRVNQILTEGYTADHSDGTTGSLPPGGVPLFQYATTPTDAGVVAQHTRVAQTLTVNPSITTDQLAAITGTPTSVDTQPVLLTGEVSNGVPLALSALANPTNASDMVNGSTGFNAFYGAMAASVGTALNDASDQLQLQQTTVAQAKDLRQQTSGVSLDEQAMIMVQFQRAYEANSRLITVLNQITQDAINILQP